MPKSILALGLDPACADLTPFPGLTPDLVRAFIDAQLDRLRGLGYDVEGCLVDLGETAEAVTARHLTSRNFDCVMIGAGLRGSPHLLLFEKPPACSRREDLLQHHSCGHCRSGAAMGLNCGTAPRRVRMQIRLKTIAYLPYRFYL